MLKKLINQPAILDENLLTEIKTLVAKALDALHIKFGASHAEIMINESNDIQLIRNRR